MESLVEVSTWTVEEVHAELLSGVPDGCVFHIAQISGYWEASFSDADGHVLWSDGSVAYNVLLLSAYTWLWLKKGQDAKRVGGNWVRHRVDQPAPSRSATIDVPDPADLDPIEIEAVYGRRRSPNA